MPIYPPHFPKPTGPDSMARASTINTPPPNSRSSTARNHMPGTPKKRKQTQFNVDASPLRLQPRTLSPARTAALHARHIAAKDAELAARDAELVAVKQQLLRAEKAKEMARESMVRVDRKLREQGKR